MDLVLLTLLATVVTMLLTSTALLTLRRPPVERHQVQCPEDQEPAELLVTWDASARRVAIAGCERPCWAEGGCPESCLPALAERFPKQVATIAVP